MKIASSEKPHVSTSIYYAGHLIVSYFNAMNVDIFKINGPLVDRIDLESMLEREGITIKSVNFLKLPRLDWQERTFDNIQRS